MQNSVNRISWSSMLAGACAVAMLAAAAPVTTDQVEAEAPRPRLAAAPPSLDELLGLPGDAESSSRDAEEAARRDAEEALRRRLEDSQRTVSAFAEAIEKMIVSADMLDARFDPGIGTQRIQEEVIAKLTHLIDEACKQCASSSASSQGQSRNEDRRQDPGRQEQSGQEQAQGNRTDGEPGEGEPPAMQQGDVHTMIGEARTEWGALPERIREMLMQGRQEKFSSLYQQLTQEYYRALASE